MKRIFHSFGLGSLFSAVFLKGFVFLSIFFDGSFYAVEPNIPVLVCELFLTLFSCVYLVVIGRVFLKKVFTPK